MFQVENIILEPGTRKLNTHNNSWSTKYIHNCTCLNTSFYFTGRTTTLESLFTYETGNWSDYNNLSFSPAFTSDLLASASEELINSLRNTCRVSVHLKLFELRFSYLKKGRITFFEWVTFFLLYLYLKHNNEHMKSMSRYYIFKWIFMAMGVHWGWRMWQLPRSGSVQFCVSDDCSFICFS